MSCFVKRFLRRAWKASAWILCRLLPVQRNKIVISNYYGRGYGDNAKYIAEFLLNSHQKVKIIWLIKNDEEGKSLPSGVSGCKIDTFAGIYHLSTGGIWIDNCRKWTTLFKRKNQFYIQTWHGGGAQKKVERDVEEVLDTGYVRAAKNDSKMADLMVSDSRFVTDLFHRSFWYDGPVYECGYPRYDILLKPNDELSSKVYEYFGIDRDKELVLYAPTFRADYSFKAYEIDFERLRLNLKKRFNREYVILVHLHPNVANMEGGLSYNGSTVINATFYPDTQELLAAASVLISDYSSISYDFSMKYMPIFRYVADLDEYRNDRDLYFRFDEYPYPYAQNNDELEELILNFDEEEYQTALSNFFEKLGAVICDDSAEKIASLIAKTITCKNKDDFFAENKAAFVYKEKA